MIQFSISINFIYYYVSCRTEQHEAVLELARRLDKNSNPASLQRCADYLASHRHYDAAVDLLAMAGKVSLRASHRSQANDCLESNTLLSFAVYGCR